MSLQQKTDYQYQQKVRWGEVVISIDDDFRW